MSLNDITSTTMEPFTSAIHQVQVPLRRLRHQTRTRMTKSEREELRRRERREKRIKQTKLCCKRFFAFLFSHLGLSGLIVAYTVIGGLIFYGIEKREEQKIKREFQKYKIDLIRNLTIIMLNGTLPNGTVPLLDRHASIRALVDSSIKMVVEYVTKKGWNGLENEDELNWSFAGSLLFAVTVITTIGYGHVAPKTSPGRLLTIGYAFLGIPLTFLYLNNIGDYLADAFRLMYSGCCCGWLPRFISRHIPRHLPRTTEWMQRLRKARARLPTRHGRYSSKSGERDDNFKGRSMLNASLKRQESLLDSSDTGGFTPSKTNTSKSPVSRRTLLTTTSSTVLADYDKLVENTKLVEEPLAEEDDISMSSKSTNMGGIKHSVSLPAGDVRSVTESATGAPNGELSKCYGYARMLPATGGMSNSNLNLIASKKSKPKSKKDKIGVGEHRSRSKKRRLRPTAATAVHYNEDVPLVCWSDIDCDLMEFDRRSMEHIYDRLLTSKETSFCSEISDIPPTNSPTDIPDTESPSKRSEITNTNEVTSSPSVSFSPTHSSATTTSCSAAKAVTGRLKLTPVDSCISPTITTPSVEPSLRRVSYFSADVAEITDSDTIDTMIEREKEREQERQQELKRQKKLKKVTVPLTLSIVIMMSYIIFGSLLYTIWEEADYIKWSYFCFITLSTIGFGDIVPGTKVDSQNPKEKMIALVLYVAIGLSVFAMCFKLMQEEAIEKIKWLAKKLGIIKKKTMNRS